MTHPNDIISTCQSYKDFVYIQRSIHRHQGLADKLFFFSAILFNLDTNATLCMPSTQKVCVPVPLRVRLSTEHALSSSRGLSREQPECLL